MRDGALACGNCDFALARHADEALAAKAEAAGHPIPPLHCLRFPTPVAKAPLDLCGDHSELIARRQLELADMVALAVVKQSRVTPANGGETG